MCIAHEDGLADEEIVEVDVFVVVDVGVVVLFEGQVDVEANAGGSALVGAFVAGFHDAGSSSCDGAEAVVGNFFGDFDGHFIVFVAGLGACRAEDGHTRAVARHFFHAFDKFGHDFEHRPGVVRFDVVPRFGMEAVADDSFFFFSDGHFIQVFS